MPPEPSRDPGRVREMFGAIARRYDLLNRVLSLGLDRAWRRAAAGELDPGEGDRVLDLCGGTGDLTVELTRRAGPGLVVCCDFARPMLVRARRKLLRRRLDGRWALLEADGLRLPFPDESFDGVTVAFGVRNFADLDRGLREILRVLRPGARLVVLEFSQPTRAPLAPLYRFYLRRVLPWIGDRVARRRGPYRYLATTIAGFASPATLAGRLRQAGFAGVGWRSLTGGIVAIHTAVKAR